MTSRCVLAVHLAKSLLPNKVLHTRGGTWYLFCVRTTVEMDSNTAIRLRKLADARRVSVEELIAAHVPGLAGDEPDANGSSEERVQAFEAWVAEFPKDTPPLFRRRR